MQDMLRAIPFLVSWWMSGPTTFEAKIAAAKRDITLSKHHLAQLAACIAHPIQVLHGRQPDALHAHMYIR